MQNVIEENQGRKDQLLDSGVLVYLKHYLHCSLTDIISPCYPKQNDLDRDHVLKSLSLKQPLPLAI